MIDEGIRVAKAYRPLLEPAAYKGAYGGRGAGRSHFFATLLIAKAISKPGFRAVCIREIQKDLKHSAKMLIEDKIRELGVTEEFRCLDKEIKTPGGGTIIFQGMQDHNADSLKSLENFDVAWIEEGQTISSRSLELLRPTIRAEGSEIWASWNPRSATDPVDVFFRGEHAPPDSICIRADYRDNPWFTRKLEMERQHDEQANPVRYAHIWLGDYEPSAIGALWTRQMFLRGRKSSEDIPTIARIVVAVDPNTSSETGADEAGIIVAGIGEDQRGYVLEDGTVRGGPSEWSRKVVLMYDKWDADSVVIEKNQGGDMCRMVLRAQRPSLPIIEVVATRGKHVRAEPIAALYADDRISHVGTFPRLEDQLCQITASGYDGPGSPDRADALVWAFTQLFPSIVKRSETRISIPPRPAHHSQHAWMN